MNKDVFGFWQIEKAKYTAKGFPVIHGTQKIPEEIVLFTNMNKETSLIHAETKSIHSYQYDYLFEPAFSNKTKLLKKLETLRKYQSIILPDFSVYFDMPLPMQQMQIYKSRAAGNFLMQNDIPIIPNIRWSTEQSYSFCFEGIDKNALVAVGSYGAFGNNRNKFYFEAGFYKMIEVLEPSAILIYGFLSDALKNECRLHKIWFKEFATEQHKYRTKEKNNYYRSDLFFE